jgi:hypothetical protein
VVNNENRTGAETLSTFLVRENGTVYFTNMSNGLMEFVLIAESMKSACPCHRARSVLHRER